MALSWLKVLYYLKLKIFWSLILLSLGDVTIYSKSVTVNKCNCISLVLAHPFPCSKYKILYGDQGS